ELRVVAAKPDGPADDIVVGELALVDRPVADVLNEGSLDVTVADADTAAPLPCRVTVVDARGCLMPIGTPSADGLAVRTGAVYTVGGRANVRLPAGRYTVYAGRGFEYSVARAEAVEVRAGAAGDAAKPARVKLAIRRVVPTPGLVACDTHVHTFTWSRHGDATAAERAVTLAGEGIELPVSTDHNLVIDPRDPIAAAGVGGFLTPIVGTEMTTPAAGHFNVFPIAPGRPPPDWRARDWPAVVRNIETIVGPPGPDGPVVILNHARDVHGNFRPFDPSRHVSLTGEDLDGWPMPANAMEVINSGATRQDPMELYRDWFGMLNRGHRLTPIGSSDSHDVTRYIVGQGRTYVRVDDSDLGKIDVAAARKAIREGRVLVSYGLLADIRVDGKYGPGDVVPAKDEIEVEVRVLGPEWTRATRVVLYANGVPVKEAEIKQGAEKPGEKWRTTWRIPKPRHDVNLVAIATGPGVTAPYWPAAKPYQRESGAWSPYVIGSTAAVWVDADGDGKFEPAVEYARKAVGAGGGPATVLKRLARSDRAVAAQAASLLWPTLGADAAKRLSEAAGDREVDEQVRWGVQAYVDERTRCEAARAARPTTTTAR
ncbi:MAG TPA: CehA/McbA family metallohydrolase, partial [Humisphaera sp.]